MKDNLLETKQRIFQYWYIDGLPELALGGIFLILGLYFYIQAVIPNENLLGQILNVGFVVIIIGSVYLTRFLIGYFKNRLTYPRTGYVAYQRKPGQYRWIRVILAMGIAALVAGLIIAFPGYEKLMPAITAIILSLVFLTFGYRGSILRFYLLSLISLVLGGVFSFLGTGGNIGLGYYYFLIGMICSLSGGCILRSYLKKYPDKPEDDHVG